MTDLEIVDDFELDELRSLAPTDLSPVAPDWEWHRDAILADTMATAGPASRRSLVVKLAAASVALLAVGSLGWLIPRGTTVMPANPAATSSSNSASATINAVRTIKAGHYLVLRSSTLRYETAKDAATGETTTRVESYDSSGALTLWIDGKRETVVGEVPLNLSGAPADPRALGAWLLTGRGGTYVPPKADATTTPSPDDQVRFQFVIDYLRDPRTTKEFRAALIAMAETNGVQTHLVRKTVDGRSIIEIRYGSDRASARDTLVRVDARTLDLISVRTTYIGEITTSGTPGSAGTSISYTQIDTYRPLVDTTTAP